MDDRMVQKKSIRRRRLINCSQRCNHKQWQPAFQFSFCRSQSVYYILTILLLYMMHREAFRRRKQEQESPQSSEDKTTAEEAIKNQRCAVPVEIYNDVAALASASKKTNCETQIEAIKYYVNCCNYTVNRQKLLSDCKTGEATGEVCKYSDMSTTTG
jgi:hypothetical protein